MSKSNPAEIDPLMFHLTRLNYSIKSFIWVNEISDIIFESKLDERIMIIPKLTYFITFIYDIEK